MELFGRIRVHEAFRVERLTLMIRATSSRSTERQRDRETERADLIICVALETVENL